MFAQRKCESNLQIRIEYCDFFLGFCDDVASSAINQIECKFGVNCCQNSTSTKI